MKEITYVQGDDWEGVYVDGKLELEGHSLDFRDVLDILGCKVSTIPADCNWLHKVGRLPSDLKEVKIDTDL